MVMWNENLLKPDKISTTPQGVHVMAKVYFPPTSWIFFTIYASNMYYDRIKSRDILVDIAFVFMGS